MTHTVIGIFDSAQEAQTAIQQLVSNGFMQQNIDISAQDATAATTTGTSGDAGEHDGIGGFFRSLFGGSDEHRTYSHVARRSTVVTVHAQSPKEAEQARDILDWNGAVDVNERAAQYGYTDTATTTGTATTTDAATTTTDTTTSSGTAIPIIEENIVVGKRVVETGGVRLRSRIVERPVEEHLRLRQEHVHVTRTPVNRPVTEADRANLAGGTIEAIEHAEVPVVAKEARVVEEVRLAKEVEEREEIVRDTVRSTDVDVEQFRADDASRRTGLDDDLSRPSSR
jgi:stress response protein YsnF